MPNTIAENYRLLRKKPVTERPWLIEHLVKLGCKRENVQLLTIGRAYGIIHGIIREELGGGRGHVNNYYHLWAMGIPLSHLKTLSRKEAGKMLQLAKSQIKS